MNWVGYSDNHSLIHGHREGSRLAMMECITHDLMTEIIKQKLNLRSFFKQPSL
jgi:hypothetical protein